MGGGKAQAHKTQRSAIHLEVQGPPGVAGEAAVAIGAGATETSLDRGYSYSSLAMGSGCSQISARYQPDGDRSRPSWKSPRLAEGKSSCRGNPASMLMMMTSPNPLDRGLVWPKKNTTQIPRAVDVACAVDSDGNGHSEEATSGSREPEACACSWLVRGPQPCRGRCDESPQP